MAETLVTNRGYVPIYQERAEFGKWIDVKDYEILNNREDKRIDKEIYQELLLHLNKKISDMNVPCPFLSYIGFSIISVGEVSGNIFDSINIWGGMSDNYDVLYSSSLVYGSQGWQNTPQPDGWAIECIRENRIKGKEREWRDKVISRDLSLEDYKDSFVPENFLSEDTVTISISEYAQLIRNQKHGGRR